MISVLVYNAGIVMPQDQIMIRQTTGKAQGERMQDDYEADGTMLSVAYKADGNILSVAVCDDEITECCRISGRIRQLLEEMQIPATIRQFGNGEELLQAAGQFDLIFLDILMRGLDGMETAQMLRRQAFDKLLVFLSSSRDYVWDAYDVEAFQYLVKPVEDGKLRQVLLRAARKTQCLTQEFIVVNRERQVRKLFLDDIYYFEIKGRVIDVHGTQGVFGYYGQIGVLEQMLQGRGFFRCHKSYLVNLKYAAGYNRQEAILDNGERIMIAKRRYGQFCKEMLAYMRKNGGIL